MTSGRAVGDEREPSEGERPVVEAADELRDPPSEPRIDVELPGSLSGAFDRADDLALPAGHAGGDEPAPELSSARRMAALVAALQAQAVAGEAAELSGDDMEELPTPPPLPLAEGERGPSPWTGPAVEVTVGEVRVPLAARASSALGEDGIFTSAPADPLAVPARNEARQGRPHPPAPTPVAAPARAAEGGDAERSRPAAAGRSKAWFELVFDEDYPRTLPHLTSTATRCEVDFLEQALGVGKGADIIDLGCGTGRHAVELAARGYTRVTAFDLSLPLLIRGADDSQRRGLKVNFVHGDLRELDRQEQYEAAYCLGTSFGFFDDETNRRVLQSMCRALRVGGRLLLEVVNRDYIVRGLPARLGWEGEGCLVLEEVDFNFYTSRLHNRRAVVFMDGRHVEHLISIRCYSLHELGKLLHHAGLRVLEVSGHWAHRGRFFGSDSAALIVLAERRAP